MRALFTTDEPCSEEKQEQKLGIQFVSGNTEVHGRASFRHSRIQVLSWCQKVVFLSLWVVPASVLALLSVDSPLTWRQKPLADLLSRLSRKKEGFFSHVNPPKVPGPVLLGQLGAIPETAAEATRLLLAGS